MPNLDYKSIFILLILFSVLSYMESKGIFLEDLADKFFQHLGKLKDFILNLSKSNDSSQDEGEKNPKIKKK